MVLKDYEWRGWINGKGSDLGSQLGFTWSLDKRTTNECHINGKRAGRQRDGYFVGVRWSVSSDLLRCTVPCLFSWLLNPLPPPRQPYNPAEQLIITLNRWWPLLVNRRKVIVGLVIVYKQKGSKEVQSFEKHRSNSIRKTQILTTGWFRSGSVNSSITRITRASRRYSKYSYSNEMQAITR